MRTIPARYQNGNELRYSYAWLNDEATLRKAGVKTDVYAVFRKMLARGEVPLDTEKLL